MPYATERPGRRAAHTIGAGPMGLPFSRTARHAKRTSRAERRQAAQDKADAELAKIQARHERMISDAREVQAAVLAADAEIMRNMCEKTTVIPRVVDHGALPLPEPRLARPYIDERRPEVLRHMHAHQAQ